MFGGLVDVLTTPVLCDDGWGGTLSMTHRAYNIEVGVAVTAPMPMGEFDPVACTVTVYWGKIVNNDFKFCRDIPCLKAHLTRTELKALPSITIAAILVAAKIKLALPD